LNCIPERLHVISSLKNTANRFRKSVRASLQGRATDKGIEHSPEGPAAPRSIFFAVITKRAAAMPTIAVPRTINAGPAMLPNFWPGNDRVRPAAASSRNRSNFSTRNPKAITAMAVRTRREMYARLPNSHSSPRGESSFPYLNFRFVCATPTRPQFGRILDIQTEFFTFDSCKIAGGQAILPVSFVS
jgi:hypothetical protein